MRVQLQLRALNDGIIPFNRKRSLNAWLYKLVKASDPSLAEKLHSTQNMKFFTFSDLYIHKPYTLVEEGISIKRGKRIKLFLSTPKEELLKNMILTFLDTKNKTLRRLKLGTVVFDIVNIVRKKNPDFKDTMMFMPISPIVVSKQVGGKIKSLSPEDSDFFRALEKNLEKKARLLSVDINKRVKILPLWEKVKSKLSKAISFKGAFIKGYYIPIKIEATPEINKVAYDCGIGEKNSIGFGMLKVI